MRTKNIAGGTTMDYPKLTGVVGWRRAVAKQLIYYKRIKLLYAVAHTLTVEEIKQEMEGVKKAHEQRKAKLIELEAPQIMIDFEASERWKTGLVWQALTAALKHKTEAVVA